MNDFIELFSNEIFMFGIGVGAFGCLIYEALLHIIGLSSEKLSEILVSNNLKKAEYKNVELQNKLLSAELEEGSKKDA